MKNYKNVIKIMIFIILLVGFFFFNNKKIFLNDKQIKENKIENIVKSKRFKMFIQQKDGSYNESDDDNWPISGYVLNDEMSQCLDATGNKIQTKIDFNEGIVNITTTKSAYCYIYFDILNMLIDGQNFNNIIPSDTTQIIFTDEIAPNEVTTLDVSEFKNGSYVAWSEGSIFKVSSQKDGKIILANPNSSSMFANKKLIETIDFSNFDVSNVTNMQKMFYYTGYKADKIEYDLSNWDVSKVEDMSHMFTRTGYAAKNGFTIGDISGWNVSNVKNMSSMFALIASSMNTFSINLSKWDVSNVTDMSYMLQTVAEEATSWTIGDISGWNVSNVTNMSGMLYGIGGYSENWEIGDISKWDVSNVTDMSFMFVGAASGVKNLKLDLSGWDVSNVTDMSYMFQVLGQDYKTDYKYDCEKYCSVTINISNWNVSNVTNMEAMFYRFAFEASSVKMDLSNWNVSNVTNMWGMFNEAGYDATSFSISDISRWNTMNVTDMQQMFFSTAKNANWSLNLSNWNVSKVVNYSYFNTNVESKATAPKWVN